MVTALILLPGFALPGDRFDGFLDFFSFSQVVAFQWLQTVIKLIDKGYSGGYVQLDDVFIGHVIQILE